MRDGTRHDRKWRARARDWSRVAGDEANLPLLGLESSTVGPLQESVQEGGGV